MLSKLLFVCYCFLLKSNQPKGGCYHFEHFAKVKNQHKYQRNLCHNSVKILTHACVCHHVYIFN